MKIAVTGAFSYSGKYITSRLLARGEDVITLTNHPNRPDPFAGKVKAFPLDFNNADELVSTLRGVDVLVNTYWIRFDKDNNTQPKAVENTKILVNAAAKAGVKRIVHISITNPSADSHLPYFWGKAANEKAVIDSGMSYAILRPTVLFGKEDILINNIAWLLRRLPIFGLPGDGSYKLSPVYVDDLAELAVDAVYKKADQGRGERGARPLRVGRAEQPDHPEEWQRQLARHARRGRRRDRRRPGDRRRHEGDARQQPYPERLPTGEVVLLRYRRRAHGHGRHRANGPLPRGVRSGRRHAAGQSEGVGRRCQDRGHRRPAGHRGRPSRPPAATQGPPLHAPRHRASRADDRQGPRRAGRGHAGRRPADQDHTQRLGQAGQRQPAMDSQTRKTSPHTSTSEQRTRTGSRRWCRTSRPRR